MVAYARRWHRRAHHAVKGPRWEGGSRGPAEPNPRTLSDTSFEQADGPGADALAGPLPTEALGRGGLDPHLPDLDAQRAGEVLAHRLAMGPHLGLLGGDGAVGVHELEAQRARMLHDAREQHERVGPRIGGVGIGEQLADVAAAAARDYNVTGKK